jgi:hypothetical protein
VKHHRTRWWTNAASCVVSASLALAAISPLAAAEPARPTATAAKPTLAAAALAKAAALEPRALAAPQTTGVTGTEEARSFFGSARGRIALVLLAAGIGWTVYSHSHDRIKSPIR